MPANAPRPPRILNDARIIDGAIDQYAIENNKKGTDTVDRPEHQGLLQARLPSVHQAATAGTSLTDILGNNYSYSTFDGGVKVNTVHHGELHRRDRHRRPRSGALTTSKPVRFNLPAAGFRLCQRTPFRFNHRKGVSRLQAERRGKRRCASRCQPALIFAWSRRAACFHLCPSDLPMLADRPPCSPPAAAPLVAARHVPMACSPAPTVVGALAALIAAAVCAAYAPSLERPVSLGRHLAGPQQSAHPQPAVSAWKCSGTPSSTATPISTVRRRRSPSSPTTGSGARSLRLPSDEHPHPRRERGPAVPGPAPACCPRCLPAGTKSRRLRRRAGLRPRADLGGAPGPQRRRRLRFRQRGQPGDVVLPVRLAVLRTRPRRRAPAGARGLVAGGVRRVVCSGFAPRKSPSSGW